MTDDSARIRSVPLQAELTAETLPKVVAYVKVLSHMFQDCVPASNPQALVFAFVVLA